MPFSSRLPSRDAKAYSRRYRYRGIADRTVSAFVLSGQALATPFLVGAQLYHSDAAGTDVAPGFQFSTNTGTTAHAFLPMDLLGDAIGAVDRDIAFQLNAGLNTFVFNNRASPFTRDRYGLNLFFAASATPLVVAPDFSRPGPNGVAGDLNAVTAANSSAFSVPVAGTDVASFGTQNVGGGAQREPTSYSGAAQFTVGGFNLSIADLAINQAGNLFQGSLSILATAVQPPTGVSEPASFALLGIGFASLILMRRRVGAA